METHTCVHDMAKKRADKLLRVYIWVIRGAPTSLGTYVVEQDVASEQKRIFSYSPHWPVTYSCYPELSNREVAVLGVSDKRQVKKQNS